MIFLFEVTMSLHLILLIYIFQFRKMIVTFPAFFFFAENVLRITFPLTLVTRKKKTLNKFHRA